MLKRILALSSFCLFTVSSFAIQAKAPTIEEMQTNLRKSIPDITIDSINPSPITGIYEVTSGPTVFYVTEQGNYIIYGDLLSLANNKVTNVTDNTRAIYVKKALAEIDPATFIVFPATTDKVKSTITIGTDPDCVYCKKLHGEVPALNAAGITVRYLAFPRTPEGTPSYQKSASIWCAKDPKKAIDDALKGGTVSGSPDCKHPLSQHQAFIRSIGASATPVIILENGQVLPGYMPAPELIKIIDNQPA